MSNKKVKNTDIIKSNINDKELANIITNKINNKIGIITDKALQAIEEVLMSERDDVKSKMAESWLDRIGFTRKVEKQINSGGDKGTPNETAITSAITAALKGVAPIIEGRQQVISIKPKEEIKFEDAIVKEEVILSYTNKEEIPKELLENLN